MHMADALLSPGIGGAMWVVSAGGIAFCSRQVAREDDDRKVPLMGVLGAFLFAAQMINFSIPGTGSSGHLSGGLLLAILLGPYAAFLTIASVLMVQALFFADGGLLALGCNIFNIGCLPVFVAFPLIYRKLIGRNPSTLRFSAVTLFSSIAALQLGAFAVVLETHFSEMSSLPFSAFALLMQPIHLAIGVVEGVATASIVSFVRRARPEFMDEEPFQNQGRKPRGREGQPLFALLACAVITAGLFSWFASQKPDGLEWSIAKITGVPEAQSELHGVHGLMTAWQDKVAWFPEYQVCPKAPSAFTVADSAGEESKVRLGTSVAGVAGTFLTLALSVLVGWALKKRNQSGAKRGDTDPL